MKNKALLTALSFVLVAGLSIGGTLAYLTDRDSATNTFTVGDVEIELEEEFEQGSQLMPGVDIVKKPTITNTGDNDAWVWMTIAIPSELDDSNASKNILHFNYSEESVAEGKWNWAKADGTYWNMYTEEIDGKNYNVYVVSYETPLETDEKTI